MKRTSAARCVWLVAIACAVTLSACRDNGLPDRNLPLAEAQQREFRYPVYQPSQNNPALAMGGRHWIRSLPVETVPARMLVHVGTVEGTQLFARRGEEAPYTRLYSPLSRNRWSPYVRLN
ncbi:MAG: hypothetical protein ACREK1_01725 [Longimicrobiales bacterium]